MGSLIEAWWPSTPPEGTVSRRARLSWATLPLKYAYFARAARAAPPGSDRPRRRSSGDRVVQAGGGAYMAWESLGRRAVRLSTANVGTHAGGVLECWLEPALQRSRFWSGVGGQPVPGQAVARVRFRPAHGRAASPADTHEHPGAGRGTTAPKRRGARPAPAAPRRPTGRGRLPGRWPQVWEAGWNTSDRSCQAVG